MPRKDRFIQEYIHDPYFVREKYPEPSVCKTCGVVFQGGVFVWSKAAPGNPDTMTCPACRRIADNYEGGVLYLEGEFLAEHRDEIMSVIRNTEEEERRYRPLERIMEISEEDGKVAVRTTYEHLAKKLGNALHRAFKGDFRVQYLEGEKYVRVWWSR